MKKIMGLFLVLSVMSFLCLTAGAASSDEATLQYQKPALAALDEFEAAMRYNASRVDIVTLQLIRFPQGYTQEYNIQLSGVSNRGVLTDGSAFCLIRYNEKNQCGKRESSEWVAFIPDLYEFVKAPDQSAQNIANDLLQGENEENWVLPLYERVMRDKVEGVEYTELDTVYLSEIAAK